MSNRPDWAGVDYANLRAAYNIRQGLDAYCAAQARDPGAIPNSVIAAFRSMLRHLPTVDELLCAETRDLDERLTCEINAARGEAAFWKEESSKFADDELRRHNASSTLNPFRHVPQPEGNNADNREVPDDEVPF